MNFSFRHHIIDTDLPNACYAQTGLADRDGDGRPEFVMGRQFGEIYWYKFHTPDRWSRHLLGVDSPSDVGGCILDVDGDGHLDYIAGGTWYRNSQDAGPQTRENGVATMNLDSLGWTQFFEGSFAEFAEEGLSPARVALEHREVYEVFSARGVQRALVSGRFRHNALCKSDFPTVGDWVALELAKDGDSIIHAVLPRRSKFSRGYSSKTPTEQERLIAVNIDTLCLVTGLDGDFNLRRIERYVTLAWDSGARPVIVLNKSDLCSSVDDRLSKVEDIAMGVPVHAVSALDGQVDALQGYLAHGTTTAFVGSSGVGKSTLINCLIGEEHMATTAVRSDDSHGRHTTTHRELIFTQAGGLLIDTPGLRELQMWGDDEGFRESFDDVEELSRGCRFNDCQHRSEPGCEVQAAMERGELAHDRLASYRPGLARILSSVWLPFGVWRSSPSDSPSALPARIIANMADGRAKEPSSHSHDMGKRECGSGSCDGPADRDRTLARYRSVGDRGCERFRRERAGHS